MVCIACIWGLSGNIFTLQCATKLDCEGPNDYDDIKVLDVDKTLG